MEPSKIFLAQAIELYGIRYRDYKDAQTIHCHCSDFESKHELDRSRDHLQKAIKTLNEMGIPVHLGATKSTFEEAKEKYGF